jgi:tRNA/rRNA methyltransferase
LPTLAQSDLCIVLVNTRNPLNIGAVARAMSNFGFGDLRVVHPFEASFREARSAVGASAVLVAAREYKSVAEAVADCTLVIGTTSAARRELQHALRQLDDGAKIIRRQAGKGRTAILFGSEKRGLANDDLSHCHWLMRIPTREEHGSMNLGQAAAVCLYELAGRGRGLRAAQPPKLAEDTKPADAAEQERMTSLLLETLRLSGYLDSRPGSSANEKVRRLIRRLKLSSADVELLMGMLRQIEWKIKESNDPVIE